MAAIGSGGVIANATSTREPPAATAASSAQNAAKPTALFGMLRLSPVGNGCTRVMRPHAVFSLRTIRPRQAGNTAWCSYHGNDVTTSM